MSVSTKSTNRITATEARVHFGEIYRRVTENDETIIVERNGKPGAVILSIEEFELLRETRTGAAVNEERKLPGWYLTMLEVAEEYREAHEDESIQDAVDLVHASREGRDAELFEGLS